MALDWLLELGHEVRQGASLAPGPPHFSYPPRVRWDLLQGGPLATDRLVGGRVTARRRLWKRSRTS
jgi:hypothetical protein